MLKDYGEVKRSAEDRVAWRAIARQPSTKKMTHDDDNDGKNTYNRYNATRP